MSRNLKTLLMAVTIIALISLNIYTAEQMGLKSPAPIPAIPSVTVGDYMNNVTILIHGALGPYAYGIISVNGYYFTNSGTMHELRKTTFNTYYLGLELVNVANMSFNATALDVQTRTIYFFNATVTVNMSAPTTDTLVTYTGGETNYIVLGADAFTASMEGVKYA
jgi:hypothetical protein